MVSTVTLVGLTEDVVDGQYRKINVQTEDLFDQFTHVSHILCKNWVSDRSCKLLTVPEKTLVIITGHLEQADDVGLYVVAETFSGIRPRK